MILKKNIKEPFLRDILIKLKSAVTIDNPIFLAYDVFNISARHTEEEQLQMVNMLTMFYGSQQSSSFESRKNIASSLIDSNRGYFRNWGQHPKDTKKGSFSLKTS